MKLKILILFFFYSYGISYAQNLPEVGAILEEKKDDFRGHVIMVVKQHDQTLYSYQVGLAKLDTKINIASASKWLSAAVLLSLADQGYLSLDDSIGKYLPIFSKYGKGKPSIRQCLTHTSGFPPFSNLNYKEVTLAQLIDSIAKYVPLKNKPNEAFEYGGMSYRIAGRIAEIVTGKAWAEIFQLTIASKCEMTNTLYCYEKNNPDLGGGVCSTPADYLNFLYMIGNKGNYKGTQVLSEASTKEFFKSQLPIALQKELTRTAPLVKEFASGKNISYGLGTWIYDFKELEEYQTALFCPGFTGTFPFIDSCRNIYGIILTNTKIDKVINTELNVISLVKEKYKGSCK